MTKIICILGTILLIAVAQNGEAATIGYTLPHRITLKNLRQNFDQMLNAIQNRYDGDTDYLPNAYTGLANTLQNLLNIENLPSEILRLNCLQNGYKNMGQPIMFIQSNSNNPYRVYPEVFGSFQFPQLVNDNSVPAGYPVIFRPFQFSQQSYENLIPEGHPEIVNPLQFSQQRNQDSSAGRYLKNNYGPIILPN